MIDQKTKKFLSEMPLGLTLKTIVNLLKEITGHKILVIVLDKDKNNLTMRGSSGIINNRECVSKLHEYFCTLEISYRLNLDEFLDIKDNETN